MFLASVKVHSSYKERSTVPPNCRSKPSASRRLIVALAMIAFPSSCLPLYLFPLYHQRHMPSAPSAPLLGLFFTFSTTVLLTLVSVSAPTWDKISFLDAGSRSAIIHFGVFGFTRRKASVGYRFNPSSLDFNDRSLHTPVILNLTRTLMLHPIGAGLAGLAFVSGISGVSCHRAGTAAMIFLAALTNVVCIMAFLFDMVLFGIARNSFRGQGIPSQYGNACWLTLAALVSIFLGFSTAACGMFSRYKKRTKPVF